VFLAVAGKDYVRFSKKEMRMGDMEHLGFAGLWGNSLGEKNANSIECLLS